jgi:hypothetical protein
MADSIRRRDFIKTTSILGASMAIANSANAASIFTGNKEAEIKNKFFIISFDTTKGIISIHKNDGTLFIAGATVCANSNENKHSIASGNYRHTIQPTAFSDQLGSGKKLLIFSEDKKKKLNFEIHLSLYENLPVFTAESICKNVSDHDLIIYSVEPLRVVNDEGGKMNVPDVLKIITNGAMYFNAGTIHTFGTGYKMTSDIKEVKRCNNSISSSHETVNSWWNAGLFSGYSKQSLVLGYIENKFALGQLLVSKTAPDEISFLAESIYDAEIILQPGKTIGSDRFMINAVGNPYTALENYADAVGKINNARTNSIINGWCSWFYTLAQVSEAEVVRNTEFASTHLKPFGLEYIQVDEGYQRWHGDWEGNERFPHGMKWLANKIKEHGFKAGIWISPYVISEPTEVFKQHSEWLLKNDDGTPKRVGNWDGTIPPADEDPKRYCIDITHPEAAKWLHNLIDTIANDWGYEMIKIDFVAWSIFTTNRYYDPTQSSAEVYRKGLEIIRKAAGDKCHILECGPGAITVGLIDSMRIEADVYYGFRDAAWDTYFVHPASSASAAAKRYYFHKRTWINDADHICMDILNNQKQPQR